MRLTKQLHDRYTADRMSAREAQRMAQLIAWGPAVFEAARIMLSTGTLEAIRESSDGLTREEICQATGLSDYAAKCLLEASLSSGTVIVDPESERYSITKTGRFLLNDESVRVNIDFNHDVNYLGWHSLEASLKNGRPEGLKTFGEWPTIYEGLSKLPPKAQKSWFGFDHFYSDNSFDDALRIVFDTCHPRNLFDVGGNTGRWAMRCVAFDPDVNVTILDLPGQIGMMKETTKDAPGADRIHGYGIDLLNPTSEFPKSPVPDAIWMSQFLDCFSMEQITGILSRAAKVMTADTRLFIMETLWNRQRFETAALCLTMTSLYFTALANGNSKMYSMEDLEKCILDAGLEVEAVHDDIGWGHSIITVRKPS